MGEAREIATTAEIAGKLTEKDRSDLLAIRQNRTLVRRRLMERSYYAGRSAALTSLGAAVREYLQKGSA